MIKIINPFGPYGQRVAVELVPGTTVNLTAHDLGNGHLEVVAMRPQVFEELDWDDRQIDKFLIDCADYQASKSPERLAEDAAEAAAKSLKASANRAKVRVRRLCKVMGADAMFTLTYRVNMTDLALCKAHTKEFVRRLRRVFPYFRCVCAFEQQERGAWHVHLACERVPAHFVRSGIRLKSFNVLRAVWRSVTREFGGTVNVSQGYGKKRSAARIAAYLSKYLLKAFEDGEMWSNRWTKYGAIEVPKPLALGSYRSMVDAITAAYTLLDGPSQVVNQFVSKWEDLFFLVVENQLCDSGQKTK